jgi:2-phosphosulfolactate phosphatase
LTPRRTHGPDTGSGRAAFLPRPVRVHVVPERVDPAALAGSVVVVIDALRASVTIAAALHAGAERIIPTLTVEEALSWRDRLGGSVLLGGERGGVLIPGFDLDNSPGHYTPGVVAGRTVIFTTTNGTAALRHAGHAARVLVGSLVNASAVCDAAGSDDRPVHLLCAGTAGEAGLDDMLAAGAIVEGLMARRRRPGDRACEECLEAWRGRHAAAGGLLGLMRESVGGRNLVRLGLEEDIERCSRVDSILVVPVFDPRTGAITRA